MKTDFENEDVAKVFATFPSAEREGILALRETIFSVARRLDMNALKEQLRWGQPAYIPPHKTGFALRLGTLKAGGFAIFTHCQTSIMSEFSEVHPELDFDGNRAVRFEAGVVLPLEKLEMLIRRALTYHL